MSPAWRRTLARRLLGWFAGAARDLPWRRTRDLYAIWVSEIMLQQTQVVTVIPYWQRFLARFPDVGSLAAADEHDVLRLWEGLGYYRRARQLHAAANAIALQHGGEFPRSYEAIRSLPGIGRYTAGAILSIGLDARLPILEANTIRVFSRLTAFQGDPASTAGRKHLWSVAEAVLPGDHCGAFNQALMELGSLICTPQEPDCKRCPARSLCEARRQDVVGLVPLPPKRTRYEDVTEVAIVVRRGERVLLRRCQAGERWAGLWDFPRFAVAEPPPSVAALSRRTQELMELDIRVGEHLATLKHGVTRFRITLHCYEATLFGRASKSSNGSAAVRWVPLGELADYALSTTGRKISRLLAANGRVTRRNDRASAARPRRSRNMKG
jgi:A/G-specific adenine glycosylase